MNIKKTIKGAETLVAPFFKAYDEIAEKNTEKIIKAMQKYKLSDMHFAWNTGYGYDDPGREITEKIFAEVFGMEDAIVRPSIVSGTHALSLMITGLVRPKDIFLSITGKPYDTLDQVLGFKKSKSYSLKDIKYYYKQIDLLPQGGLDLTAIHSALMNKPEFMYIQRSSGYEWRRALTVGEITEVITICRVISPKTIILLDNCYGEFLEEAEPEADVMAGSLIKNPGGGLAVGGGYIAGKKEYIERIAERMTVPGIGKECGLMYGQTRNILQGLFMAPSVVAASVKGAILSAKVFADLGYEVSPKYDQPRSDIVQSIKLKDKDKVIKFCQAIQSASPVNGHVMPMPWAMPGYNENVIMAAGAFVQGSSIELSADAPMKEPYIVYFQGGLTYAHAKIGIIKALEAIYN